MIGHTSPVAHEEARAVEYLPGLLSVLEVALAPSAALRLLSYRNRRRCVATFPSMEMVSTDVGAIAPLL